MSSGPRLNAAMVVPYQIEVALLPRSQICAAICHQMPRRIGTKPGRQGRYERSVNAVGITCCQKHPLSAAVSNNRARTCCAMRPLGSSFLKLVGLEFPADCVARVDLSEMLPFLRQVI